MKMTRRDFLIALALSSGYMMFRNPIMVRAGASYLSADPFQLVTLGKSGIETTLIGIGTGIHAGGRNSFLTRQDFDKSIAVIEHAFDAGIRFFDCADTYGTHPMMAEAFKIIPREELTLSSKIWVREGGIPEKERPDADVVVDRFRKELNTDYLDLVQLHCMVDENWTDQQKWWK